MRSLLSWQNKNTLMSQICDGKEKNKCVKTEDFTFARSAET